MAIGPAHPPGSLQEHVDGLMRRGQWKEVVSLLSEHPDRGQDFHLAWSLGWAHFKQGEFELATASLLVATRIRPKSVAGHFCLAAAYQDEGDLDRAEHHYGVSLALKDSALGRAALALVYMLKRDFRAAGNVHLEGLRLKPDDRERSLSYATFLWDCTRYREASEHYEKAIPLARRVRFTAKRPASDRIHHLSEGDVRVVLSRLPESAYRRLRAVHFNDRSLGGRVLGYANNRGKEIGLCALPPRMSLTRFLVKGEGPEEFGARKGAQWPRLAIQRFLLYDVLLHELGHLQVVRPKSSDERRKYSREPRAHEFASEWRGRLWSRPFPDPDPVHNPPTEEEMTDSDPTSCRADFLERRRGGPSKA